MESKSKTSNSDSGSPQETLIIGGGVTGLLLAHRLHQHHHFVTLVETRDGLGGRFRRNNPAKPFASAGLDFIPMHPDSQSVLDWLARVAPIPFRYQKHEHLPQLFDDGRWKPFTGFGDSHFESVGDLTVLYNHSQCLEIEPGLDQLARTLHEQLPFEAQTRAEVTGMHVKDGRIYEVVLNGEKTVSVQNVIFTGHPTALNALLPADDLPPKHRTRLAKMQNWTAVVLELHHTPPLIEDSHIRVFTHSAKDFEPVVGRGWQDFSKWMTLVPGDREADHEYVGQCIRHIKRQLKRAWPSVFQGPEGQADLAAEKIFVHPNVYGQGSLKTKDPFQFPEISNLYVANHTLASLPGEVGALEVAWKLEQQLLGTSNQLPELSASC